MKQGRPGVDGEDGESAFLIARRNGFVGTEADWLSQLRGKDGERGADGKDGRDGVDGARGTDGTDGKDGRDGLEGPIGLRGEVGKAGMNGADGVDGLNGWTQLLAVVEDGERRVLKITGWVGGSGDPPVLVGVYLGPQGPVRDISDATDIRGPAGQQGRERLVSVGGGGMSQAAVIALVESLTMEDFDQVPLPEQTAGVSAEVLTFTFDAEVHKVWVKMIASSADDLSSGRVRTDGVDPDADEGQPIEAGVPQPIAVVTSEVRVYTPAGKTINVTGYRRRS